MVLTRFQANRDYSWVNDNKNHRWEFVIMGYTGNVYVVNWIHRHRHTKNSKATDEIWFFDINENYSKFEQFEKAYKLFKKIKRGEYLEEIEGARYRIG